MTTEYQRGYSKGYSTGHTRGYRSMDRLIRIGKELRERAERAESGLSLGTCKECRHWTRGPDHQTDDVGGFRWGMCARFGMGSAGIDQPWFGDYREKVSTQEHFGCVLFRAAEPPVTPFRSGTEVERRRKAEAAIEELRAQVERLGGSPVA